MSAQGHRVTWVFGERLVDTPGAPDGGAELTPGRVEQ